MHSTVTVLYHLTSEILDFALDRPETMPPTHLNVNLGTVQTHSTEHSDEQMYTGALPGDKLRELGSTQTESFEYKCAHQR